MSCYILPGMACMRRDAQCTIKPCGSDLSGEKQIFWCKPLPIVEILQIAGSEGSESITWRTSFHLFGCDSQFSGKQE